MRIPVAKTEGRMYGDWSNVMPKLILIQESITPAGLEALKEAGKAYIEQVVKNIREQSLPLLGPALSSQYRKVTHKKEWWIETERFIGKLAVHSWQKGPKKASVVAGALKRRKYNKKQTMFKIASRIENGWSKAPARPLFRMTLEKMDFSDIGARVGMKITTIWKV